MQQIGSVVVSASAEWNAIRPERREERALELELVVSIFLFFLTLAGSSIHLEEQVADSSRQQAAAILELTGQLASVCYIFLTLAGSSIHLEEQVADSSRQQAAAILELTGQLASVCYHVRAQF